MGLLLFPLLKLPVCCLFKSNWIRHGLSYCSIQLNWRKKWEQTEGNSSFVLFLVLDCVGIGVILFSRTMPVLMCDHLLNGVSIFHVSVEINIWLISVDVVDFFILGCTLQRYNWDLQRGNSMCRLTPVVISYGLPAVPAPIAPRQVDSV